MLVFMGVGPWRASGVTPCWAAIEFNKYMHASQREDFSHALMMAPRNSCDRLQTFGNPTASSTLSKSSSDNYHRNENSSFFWGLPSTSTSSTLHINIASLCYFIHHLLSLYYRLLWMWCGWNFPSYPSISSRLQLAQKELITVICNWL